MEDTFSPAERKLMHDPLVPENFFSDVILRPSFYMPETDELKFGTHNNIRRTIFFATFQRIKELEYSYLKRDEDFFEFVRLDNNASEGWIDFMLDRYLSKDRGSRVVGVQKWIFNRCDKK